MSRADFISTWDANKEERKKNKRIQTLVADRLRESLKKAITILAPTSTQITKLQGDRGPLSEVFNLFLEFFLPNLVPQAHQPESARL